MNAHVGWYVEKMLVERLQLSRQSIDRFRSSLTKGTDWKKDGREIVLSPGAVKRLLTDLGSPDYDISSSAIQENGARPPQEIVELVVHRKFANPRLLEARDPATGQLVRVRVPYNVNFQPHMVIKARKPGAGFKDLYLMEGRCPRYPGKW